jgi:phosphatidylglycerol:prolipoprotein diacylglycerol transferase
VAGTVHTVLGGRWLGLQLALLPLGLLALVAWGWRVRRHRPMAAAETMMRETAGGPSRSLAVVLAMMALTALLGQQVLTLPEVLVVRVLLLAVLVAEAHVGLATLHTRGPRLVGLPLSLVLAGAVLLTTAQAPAPSTPDSTSTKRTLIVSGGVLSNYREMSNASISNSSTGCGGSQQLALQQQVNSVGGEVAFENASPSGYTRTTGVGLWVGQQRIDMQPLPASNASASVGTTRQILADIHFYREAHRENGWLSFDARIGLHLGSLGYYSYFGANDTKESTIVMPELMLRLGKPTVLYGQADFCYGAENAMGAYTSRLGLGSGLGLNNGSRLLAGYAHSPHQPTSSLGFVSALVNLPGKGGLSLEPYYATDLGRHNSLSLKLNYRLAR